MPKESSAPNVQRAIELLEQAIAVLRSDATERQERGAAPPASTLTSVNLELPLRAFAKRYAKDLSGAQKFTLLVAYLAKGDQSAQVAVTDVESNWGNLTGSFGAFNRAHPTRARDNDWVNSTKQGFYHLRPSWKDALK